MRYNFSVPSSHQKNSKKKNRNIDFRVAFTLAAAMLIELIAFFVLQLASHVAGTERACDASSHVFGDGRGEDVDELELCCISYRSAPCTQNKPTRNDVLYPPRKWENFLRGVAYASLVECFPAQR